MKLLDGIAPAESQAHDYLSAWADTTANPELEAVLRKIAWREGEHGMSFAKRINELGFGLSEPELTRCAARMAIATSERSDLEKLEDLGLTKLFTGDQPDVFDGMFRDHSIDIATGELLGRYIAEERDTVRLLEECYCQLQAGSCVTPAAEDRLAALDTKVDALCQAVDELRQMVAAQVASGNGSSKKAKSAGIGS
jgi:hypothetical protein